MKKYIRICLVLLGLLMLAGCSEHPLVTEEPDELPENCIYLYYINGDDFELMTEVYELKPETSEGTNVTDILEYMLADTLGDKTNLMAEAMTMISSSYDSEKNQVHIIANVANELNDSYIDVLTKEAITLTLCQLDYVDTIRFEVYDSSVMMEGTSVEIYDEYSFVNGEEEGGSLQRGVITIYFANESGDRLLEYDKSVEITNNSSLEQLVIESLITGPLREGYGQTIPEGTTLKKISIKDGVCYVDLSGEFNGTLDTCMDVVTIYSVVNSLCELPTINKVQFLIDGEKQELYRETIPMDGMFEFQDELIERMEDEE